MSSREPAESVFGLSSKDELWVVSSGPASAFRGATNNGCVARFAEVLDQMAWKRRERLVAVFGPANFREISSSSADGIVQHNETFDVLICSVDDVARLRAALRPPADTVVKNKISFAYSEKTSPGRRAQLFKLGFDDVLFSTMTDEEIRLRVDSIVKRAKLYSELSAVLDDGEWDFFVEAHAIGALRRRQKEIVQALVQAKGKVVKYRDLASYDYASNEYNIASLKVTVSSIRKKLVGCEIVSVHGEGYCLVVKERQAA